MQSNSTVKNRIQLYLAKILLNTVIHPFFYSVLNLIRILENLIFLQADQIFEILGIPNITISTYDDLLYIILVFEVLLILILIVGVILQVKHKIKPEKEVIQKSTHVLLRRLTSDLLTINRIILILPITYTCIKTLNRSLTLVSTTSLSLSIINLVLLYLVIYPINGLIFYSKMVKKQNILSFAYLINSESLYFLYIPLMVVLKFFLSTSLPYIHLIFWAFTLITIYFHPIINFNFDIISRFSIGYVQATIVLSSFYTILNLRISIIGDLLFFNFMNLLFGYVLCQFMIKRRIRLLKSISSVAKFRILPYQGRDQALFFHLVDIKKHRSEILYYLLNLNNETLTKKKNIQIVKSQYMMTNQSLIIKQKQLQLQISQKSQQKIMKQLQNEQNDIVNKLFQLLQNKKYYSGQFEQLFYQFIIDSLKEKYNPQSLSLGKIGNKQLQIQLMHNPKTYLLISQIFMLKKNSIRKSYFLIKAHQKILKQIDKSAFFSGIQIYQLLILIQQNLQKQKSSKQINLKAQYYFNFQRAYQQLKQLIQKAAANCFQFWSQLQYRQPNAQKTNKLIQQNYFYSNKIQRKYNNILLQFERKSPLVLFDVVSKYCSVILNNKIPSLLNPYNNLITKTKQQFQIQKLQGVDKIANKNQINYSLLQQVAVCVIDIENNFGQIQWANQIFWNQVYFRNDNAKQIQFQKKLKCSIIEIIPKQFISNHKCKYFKEFAQGQHFNYKHEQALIFYESQNTVQRVIIQMQILPSIKNGLKLSVFIKKKVHQNSHFMDLIINQDLKFVAWSKKLMRQSNFMYSVDENIDQQSLWDGPQFIANLLKSDTFNQFINQIPNLQLKSSNYVMDEIKTCIKFDHNDYHITVKSKLAYKIQGEYANHKKQNKMSRHNLYLTQIQFSNIAYQIQERGTKLDEQALAKISSEPNVSKYHQINQNFIGNFESNVYNLKQDDVKVNIKDFRQPVKFRQRKQTMMPFEMGQLVQQKSQLILTNNNKYMALICNNPPPKLRTWQRFVIVFVIILILLMISNIFIILYKQNMYQTNYTIIQYFNQLVAMTPRIMVSMRGLNFYAATVGPNDAHNPYYVKQLGGQSVDIANKLAAISSVMTQEWQAYEFLSSGMVKIVKDKSYLIFSNFMLSTATYVSKLPFDKMAFPILLSLYDFWKGITVTQRKFQQLMFNGLWTIMVNMRKDRVTVLNNIINSISPVYKQLFIFPTIGGLLIISIFMTFSLHIERKSQKLKKSIYQLLEVCPTTLCKTKKQCIQLFIDRQLETKQNQKLLKQLVFPLAELTYDFYRPTNTKQSSKANLNKGPFFTQKSQETNLSVSDTIRQQNTVKQQEMSYEPNTVREQDTMRGFEKNPQKQGIKTKSSQKGMMRNSLQIYRKGNKLKTLKQSNRSKQQKQKSLKKIQNIQQKVSSIYLKSSGKLRVLFYLVVCLPFISYFLFIFIGGYYFNQKVITYYNIQYELYKRQSNFGYVYVWTRQTSIYQQKLLGKASWTNDIMGQVRQNYQSQRLFQNIVNSQLDQTSYLRQYINYVEYANLCIDPLPRFGPSIYYAVSFNYTQCIAQAQGVMTTGLKPLVVAFLQTSLILLQRYSDPGSMPYTTRVKFFDSPDVKIMKNLKAYLEQFLIIAFGQFRKDFQVLISNYIQFTIICSSVGVATMIIIFIAIYYRWTLLMKQKKHIKSLIQLISYHTIKTTNPILKSFQNINADLLM